MKKLLIGLAAAATAATVFTATPAASQVGFYAGDRGVGIGIGRDHDDWGWRHRRHYRDYSFYRDDDCRDVTVRKRLPDGSVVVRRSTRC